MSDNKHSGRGVYGKGYYIALILCAAAISVTGFLYYRNAEEAQSVIQEPQSQEVPAAATEDLPVVATQPAATKASDPTDPSVPAEKKPMKTAAPVSGETVAAYSMDCLSYNETTRDWRVHNGVDIAAEAGTEVLAAADGTVYTTYTDDIMGTTVVIRHEGGYTTQYASLSEELLVNPGDTVVLGQAIGTVGETALIETTMGPHVHFSVLQQDAPVDPAEFLLLGSQ